MQICVISFEFHAKSSQYTLKSILGVNHRYHLLANSEGCMLRKCAINLYQVEIQTLLSKVLHLACHTENGKSSHKLKSISALLIGSNLFEYFECVKMLKSFKQLDESIPQLYFNVIMTSS